VARTTEALRSDAEDERQALDEPLLDEPLLDEPLPDELLPDELLPDELLPDELLPDEPLPDEDDVLVVALDEVLLLEVALPLEDEPPSERGFEDA